MAHLFSVTQTFNTGINRMGSLTLLSNGTAVVSGDVGKGEILKNFNLETGEELCCLKNGAGLTEVKIGDKMALAVSPW